MTHEAKDYYGDWRAGADPELRDDFDDLAWMALSDLDSVFSGFWKRSQDGSFQGALLQNEASIYVQSEQAPNPDSRITLGTEQDQLGVPLMVQDCRILPIDKRTLVSTGELLARDLALLGGGRVKMADWLVDDSAEWDPNMWGGCHHMGTARMTDTDADGVVDKNCKLHTVDNTYLAGGSVFSTGGYANPTVSIVALGLRLAEHIKSIA